MLILQERGGDPLVVKCMWLRSGPRNAMPKVYAKSRHVHGMYKVSCTYSKFRSPRH